MGWSLKNLIDPTGLIVGGGLSGDSGGLFGGGAGGGSDSIVRPKYYTDPAYTETQGALKDFGLGILKGEVPDYYKAIGETGSKEFEDMLGLQMRDVKTKTAEGLAAKGMARGGNIDAITAGALADTAIGARYSDYSRALAGKERLLGTGITTTQGVRSAAQQEGGNQNAFNWKDYNAQVEERAYQQALKDKEDAALGELIGTIASVGLGMATGGASFGLQGAMAGGMSALTGGSDMSWLLNKNPKQAMAGVGSLGSIDLGTDVEKYFNL